jgi:hypothetical protein
MRGRGEKARAALARGLVWAPLAIVLASSLYFLNSSVRHLQSTVSDPEGIAAFTHADSLHYLEMAEAFAGGEFTERYARVRPHRQPLYPALLAIAVLVGEGRNFFLLGMVNVLVGLGTIWLIFLVASRLFSSPLVGALTALLYARNDFAFDYITDRIMTEPLYTLLSFAAVAFALLFAERGRAQSLYLASFAGGLAYLTRPNGFILMVALWGVLGASEILVLARSQGWRPPDWHRLRGIAARFAVAGLIFVATTVPSWAPRLAFYGSPLHHGVVSNAMWVDTWEELRAKKNEPLGPSDYFADHGLSDVASRFLSGFELVYVTAPQELTPKIHLLAVAGMVVAVARRRRRDLVLVGAMVLTLLPITWTSLSMPFFRIAYGAQFAFILLFSAVLLEFARDLAARASAHFSRGRESGYTMV